MFRSLVRSTFPVKVLTLCVVAIFAASCTTTQQHKESCNLRAYLDHDLEQYINGRFGSKAPIRMAIIPFSTPVNFAWQNSQHQGMGKELAWRFQSEFLTQGSLPIVEVFNREDWPGKRDEFWTGNFGSIAQAREAGYDLVFVGNVDPMRGINNLTIHSKIIDVDAGITIWSGTTNVRTEKPTINRSRLGDLFGPEHQPSQLYIDDMITLAAACTIEKINQVDYAAAPKATAPPQYQPHYQQQPRAQYTDPAGI